jgi:hypothetical protein
VHKCHLLRLKVFGKFQEHFFSDRRGQRLNM